jgi:hypothetical protein
VDAKDVPQDGTPTYDGGRKLVYAVREDGAYVAVPSTGWEAEGDATAAALAAIEVLRRDAWRRAQSGLTSPLEYYMCLRRMDLALLAKTTGLFRWRIRRHFRPEVYARLGDRVLERYADALGFPVATLRELAEWP